MHNRIPVKLEDSHNRLKFDKKNNNLMEFLDYCENINFKELSKTKLYK